MGKKPRTVTVPRKHIITVMVKDVPYQAPTAAWLASLEAMMLKKGYRRARRTGLLSYVVW